MKHTNNGNCWKPAHRCKECGKGALCPLCHAHGQPRGSCKVCRGCLICEAEEEIKRLDAQESERG